MLCMSIDNNQWILRTVNSSPPSAAYMSRCIGSALVQIMACRLFGAKPLSEPVLSHSQLDPQEQTSVKFESKHFIHENAYENIVCGMAAILSRERWINFFVWILKRNYILQVTPTSSLCLQLWHPQQPFGLLHSPSSDSLPRHSISSSQMGPKPTPNAAQQCLVPPI